MGEVTFAVSLSFGDGKGKNAFCFSFKIMPFFVISLLSVSLSICLLGRNNSREAFRLLIRPSRERPPAKGFPKLFLVVTEGTKKAA